MLAEDHPDLLARAVFMEQVALLGRHKPRRPVQGLSQGLKWTDFALGNLDGIGLSGSPLWQAHLMGGVVRTHATKQTAPRGLIGSEGVWDKKAQAFVAYIPPGSSVPVELAPNEHYTPLVRLPGLPPGQLLSRKEVNSLIALAKRWIKAAPDKGVKIRGKVDESK